MYRPAARSDSSAFANRTDGPESVAGQDQADGADARQTQPGRLATRGMVIEHHLPTRMFEGDGEDGDLPRVEISRVGGHREPEA